MYSLIALCLAGLEDLVVEDIRRQVAVYGEEEEEVVLQEVQVLSQPQAVVPGEACCGKILLHFTTLPPRLLQDIRSVQCWLVHVADLTEVSMVLDEVVAEVEQKVVPTGRLQEAYRQWRDLVLANQKDSQTNPPADPPTFCVRSVRDGDQRYQSLALSRAMGDLVVLQTQWKVSLKEMDLEVLCLASQTSLLIGMLLPVGCKQMLKSRLPSEARPPYPTASSSSTTATIAPSIRPSTAYLMLLLGKAKAHEIVLDGLCGSAASGMTEAAFAMQAIAFGGDADPVVTAGLVESRQRLKSCAVAEGLLWSCKRLPVIDGVVDVALLAMPFSKQQTSRLPSYQRPRPGQVVAEMARILSLGQGRCVLLTVAPQQLRSCLDSIYFHSVQVYPVNVGGYLAYFVTAHRTTEKFIPREVLRHVEEDEAGRATLSTTSRKRSLDLNHS
eukprot:gene6283-6928_t